MLNRPNKHILYTVKKFASKKPQVQMHAHPYPDTAKISSIYTGLSKQWKYSPLFIYPISETYVELTGSRKKDYILAESKTNTKHIPGLTVWHHVWEKKPNGEYRMQLVDISLHQATCPHAGGCKLWSIENNKKYKSHGGVYVSDHLNGCKYCGKMVYKSGEIRIGQENPPYYDFAIDYIFEHEQNVCRLGKRFSSKKKFTVWGLDPYGNTFFADTRGDLYFFDHENGWLVNVQLNESEILTDAK